jgi:hypothetical protein
LVSIVVRRRGRAVLIHERHEDGGFLDHVVPSDF